MFGIQGAINQAISALSERKQIDAGTAAELLRISRDGVGNPISTVFGRLLKTAYDAGWAAAVGPLR